MSAACGSLLVRGLVPRLSPLSVNAVRCCLAAAGFGLLWWLGPGTAGEWLRALPLMLLVAFSGLVVGDSLYFAAITRLGPGRATPIAMSYPLPTAVLAALLFGEHMPAIKAAGIVLGVVAIWLIAARPRRGGPRLVDADRSHWIGVGLAIAAALCWSLGVLVLRPALQLVPLDFANLMRMSFAGLMLMMISYRTVGAESAAMRSPGAIVLILGLGLAAVTTSYMLTESVYHAGAAVAALMSSMTPVFVAPMARLLFKEAIGYRAQCGIALGVVSIALVVLNPG